MNYIPDESIHGPFGAVAELGPEGPGVSKMDISGILQKVMPIMLLSSVMGSFGGNGVGNIFRKIMPLILLSALLPTLTGALGGGGLFG